MSLITGPESGPVGQAGTPPMQQRVSLDQLEEVVCASCQGDLFDLSTKLRRVSRILTGAPDDQYVPIEVMVCRNCDAVFAPMDPTLRGQ